MPKTVAPETHPAEKYVSDVLGGGIAAGKWVRKACERHRRDLRDSAARGLWFDPVAAQRVIDFFGFLRHSKGEWTGQAFTLEPWQQFVVWVLFGWKKADGFRRFNLAYIEVARGNGKTTLLSGIGLYLFFADGEGGAEVYCAATKKDQAKILFSEAERMRAASPALKKRIQSFRNNMNIPGTASKFEPISADADTQDGLNAHGGIIDEFHMQKTRELLDKIETSMGKRRQPLLFEITTAGHDRTSICWDQHEYAEKILERIKEDDTFFAYIAALDDGDDWQDERVWIKANPCLGTSVKIEELRKKAHKATQNPASINSFLRYRLNKWTSSETAAIRVEDWRACVGFSLEGKDAWALRCEIEKRFEGRECFIAVDLSSTEDLCCSLKFFPPDAPSDPFVVIPHFWLPEDKLEEKKAEWRMPYDVWQREGFIQTTEGNVIDYDAVEAQVLDDVFRYSVREITFDPWNATQFANNLQRAGIPPEKLVKFPQTVAHYAEPTKRLLEVLIPQRKIAHLANPILAWNASNLTVREDPNGSKRPMKGKGRGKIDGMVALLMGYGRFIGSPDSEEFYSGPAEVTLL
jgi:phage terminase large subunit-like protein